MSGFEMLVPPECQDCQIVQTIIGHLRSMEVAKNTLSEQAMSDAPEDAAREFVDRFSALGIDTPPLEIMSKDFRIQAAQGLDLIDDHVAEVESMGKKFVTGCLGILRMRTQRDGVTYTVGVCTSPCMPRGTHTEPTSINRTGSS